MIGPLARDDAVRRISDRLQDRTAYVIAAPPHMVDTITSALAELSHVECILDNGTDTAMVATPAAAAIVTALLPDMTAAVLLVDKSTPIEALRDAMGDRLPADGSKDMILLGSHDETHMYWPRLLVDAIAVCEPLTAAAISAADIRRMS